MSTTPVQIAVIADIGHHSARVRLEAFAREARSRGWALRFMEQVDGAGFLVREASVSGVFVCNIDPATGLHAALRRVKKPVVEASRRENTPWPQVFVDESALARMALDHFRLLQRRHYAFCGRAGALGTRERSETFAGLLEAPEESFMHRDIPVNDMEGSRRILRDMLRGLPLPACLFCYEDRIAEWVLEECGALGLRVPWDIAVLSCGDDPLLSSLGNFGLSSIVFPGEEIGRRAALLLGRMLDGEDFAGQVHRVRPLELHVRDSSDPAATGDAVLARAMAHIRDHLGDGCPVDAIARAAGVSRRALEVRFRDKLGTSVHAHVLEMRMARACTLIRSTRHGFEEIAGRCGFASPATFSRAFRARFGHPPSALRKR